MPVSRVAIITVLALLSHGCASRRPAAAPAALVDRPLLLPSLGISIPTPRGWVQEPERMGSIGFMSVATWYRPRVGAPEEADASISVSILNEKAGFEELKLGLPGPLIGGRPSLRVIYAPTPERNLFGSGQVEGYRVAVHGTTFYLLHSALDPAGTESTFRAVIDGVRWSQPVLAHRALAMNGRRKALWHDKSLYYEVPDPFWNNPFRGSFYDPQSLVRDDDQSEGSTHFEVDDLAGATTTTTDAALAAAAQKELYYGNAKRDPVWHKLSSDPEVHVSELSPTPTKAHPSRFHGIKLIVARAPERQYVRIAFSISGTREVMEAYDRISDGVARSISRLPAPRVPKLPTTHPSQ
jgi:hypothetical protein